MFGMWVTWLALRLFDYIGGCLYRARASRFSSRASTREGSHGLCYVCVLCLYFLYAGELFHVCAGGKDIN